jgi:hypothetical protein
MNFCWAGEEPKLLLVQKVHLKDGHSSVASQLLQPHSYCVSFTSYTRPASCLSDLACPIQGLIMHELQCLRPAYLAEDIW